jgi:hypothetical protein
MELSSEQRNTIHLSNTKLMTSYSIKFNRFFHVFQNVLLQQKLNFLY